jgi:Protein kinase domain
MAASPSPTSDEQVAIGSVLDDRYRIDAVLGTGGMGRVYRAEHTKIGKMVAIKVLHADLGRNREASQRFQREAIASGRLDHPNIVGVSDFGVLDGGACYLVMEILEGESLGDRLARDHRIHWVEAIDILRGVLSGLRHAHERGVVHRDIKPDNIYLAHKDGDTVIKILDFGIAKLYAGSADDPASTRAGLTVGTPAYLSPEQAVGGEITPASDLYSASIVLYEMLAGRAPFEDKDPLAMLGAHVSRRPPPFADTAPGVDIPPPLEEIIQRGLMKTAVERIGTAGDYLAMLDAFSPPLQPAPRRATAPVMAAAEWGSSPTQVPGAPGGLATPAPGMVTVGLPTPAPVPRTGPVVAPGTGPVVAPGTGPVAAPRPMTSGPLPAAAEVIEVAPLPLGRRAVSLADVSEPIPLTWIIRSGVVIGLVIVGAIVLAIAAHCGGSESTSSLSSPSKSAAAPPPSIPAPVGKPPAGSPPTPSTKPPAGSPPATDPDAKPPATEPSQSTSPPPSSPSAPPPTSIATAKPPAATPKPTTAKPAAGTAKSSEHDAQLKALLHELEAGKNCAERKATISKLVELHDPHAIAPLKAAHARMTGGAATNNTCLKADAEHAIKELGGTLK